MDNNEIINILKTIESKINNIESKITNIESKIDNIESKINNIELRYNRMDNHLDLVEDVYYKMKLPLNYFINRVNNIINNSDNCVEYNNTAEID